MPSQELPITLRAVDDRSLQGTGAILAHLGPEKLEAFSMMATCIVITDERQIIRFVNPAAQALFAELEPYLQVLSPGFVATSMVGQSVDMLNMERQNTDDFRRKMGDPKGNVFSLGEFSFGIRSTALKPAGGPFLGLISELWDATPEVAIRDQVETLLNDLRHMAKRHLEGATDVFSDPERYEGIFSEVSKEINDMVRSHIGVQDRVLEALEGFSQGRFDLEFPPMPGRRASISQAVERMRGNFLAVIEQIGRISAAVQDGHLDIAISPQDFEGDYRRVLESFAAMLDQLNAVFASLGSEVSQATVAVSQMSRSAQDLASNSQVQSASVDEVSSSAEETDAQVKANAAAAGQANQLVTGAASVAAEGKEKIARMVQAMEGIRASSQDIAKIIKVIDEIAFQTNLLALNAAVEAARAGQHGRGFAVVAQEVRNLAGRSARAARETSDLIESAGARVQAGVKIADETSRAFTSIADDIEKVRSFMREIAVASDEQARGVAQINTAMGEVAKTALMTSQQADAVAAGAAEIEAATQRMREEMSLFRLRAETAAPAAGAMPDLSSLPPELLGQIMAMVSGQRTANGQKPATSLRNTDRDERGFKGF